MKAAKHILSKTRLAWRLSAEMRRQFGRSRLVCFGDMAYWWARARINPASYALYGFARRSAAEKAEYLSKRQLDALQMKLNHSRHIHLADNKLDFYERCLECGLPTPRLHGVVPAGQLRAPRGVPVADSPQRLGELLGRLGPAEVILKTIDGGYGLGALILECAGETIRDKCGTAWTASEVYEHCRHRGVNSYGGKSVGFLIQEYLRPAPELRQVMPGPALGTLRVVTLLLPDDGVEVLYAFAKVPVAGNFSDNLNHGRSGNLLAEVDYETGRMRPAWSGVTGGTGMELRERHPDTGVSFESVRIPEWPRVLELARRAALAFREIKTIGWDIAVTDRGLQLIEANWHYDPDGPQVIKDRGVRSEIERHFASAQPEAAGSRAPAMARLVRAARVCLRKAVSSKGLVMTSGPRHDRSMRRGA